MLSAPFAGPPKSHRKLGAELYWPDALRLLVSQEPRQQPCARIASSLGVLSAAVGNGAVLVADRLFSAPVNASMGFVVIDDTDGSAQVVSSCAQALMEIQDGRLTHLTEEGFQDIEKQIEDLRREQEAYFGKAQYRSPRIEAQSTRPRFRPCDGFYDLYSW